MDRNLYVLLATAVLLAVVLILQPTFLNARSLWESGQHSDYQDRVAVKEGDILMIEVSEQASATSENNREREKDVTVGGQSGANQPNSNVWNDLVQAIPIFGATFTGASEYESERQLDTVGTLNTQMSVRVDEIQEGGILKLEGERRMKLDDEVKTLKFEGYARTDDVRPDNTIPSNRIADAKIYYESKLGLSNGEADNVISKSWVYIKNVLFY